MSLVLGGLTGINMVIGGMGGAAAAAIARPDAPVNVTFIGKNWLDDATLTASEEQAGLPADNLKKQKRAKSWASNVKSSAPFSVTLKIVFTAPKLVRFFGMVEHNLPADATIRIQGNSEDSFTGDTPFDETIYALEQVSSYGEGMYGWGGYGGYLSAIEGKAQPPRCAFLGYDTEGNSPYYQYWLLTFTVPTLDAITYTDIGRIYLCDFMESQCNFVYGFEQGIVDPSDVDDSLGDADIENSKDIYSEVSLSIPNVSDDEVFYRFFDFYYNIGRKRNFILMLSPATAAGRYNQSFYGRFKDRIARIGDGYNQNSITLSFKEAVR